MSIKLITIECPNCHANLNVEEGRQFSFCQYCGTKVLLHNENEHIYRNIDEASIKQAETDLKKAEMEKEIKLEKMKQDAKEKKFSGLFLLILPIICFIFYAISSCTK